MEDSPDGESAEEPGERHSLGGQEHAWPDDGTYVHELRAESSGKEDDAEGHTADELRCRDVVELQPQSVVTEEHADRKEKEQGGYAELRAQLVGEDAGEEEQGGDEEEEFDVVHGGLEVFRDV